MALLTVVTASRSGDDVAGTLPTVTSGDTFANTGQEFAIIKNGSGGAMTVTLDVVATLDGQAVTDKTVTIADGVTKIIGPFPTGVYNDGSGLVKITCAPVTTSTIKVFKCAPASLS